MSYAVPLPMMETIRSEVEREVDICRDQLTPRVLDPRIVANRDIHLRGQEAYMGEAVPELAHAKTRSEQAGCP